MKNLDTVGQAVTRLRREGPRKPCRSLKEMAEEFGVTLRSLVVLLKSRNGPEPKLRHRGATSNNWYDPDAMRKWWDEGGKP